MIDKNYIEHTGICMRVKLTKSYQSIVYVHTFVVPIFDEVIDFPLLP